MRDSYLLAASLLTGLAIPASGLPQLSMIQLENHPVVWNLKQGSLSSVGEKVIPSVEISLPEFSNQVSPYLKSLPPTVEEKIAPSAEISSPEFSNQVLSAPKESSFKVDSQPADATLVSGKELYYQRLGALKTGQIYTRFDDDNMREALAERVADKRSPSGESLVRSSSKHQLTYEDWKSLLALEGKAIARGQGANHLNVLVGDSLSMWFPARKLPTGKLWLNQGISGDTSSGVLKRLSFFSKTRPDVIYVMAGINDLRNGVSDETILRNHRRIIRTLKQSHPESLIIIQSILPTRQPKIPNTRIRHINEQLALIAKEQHVNYLNIHNWFTDSDGNLREDLTTDGLHLSTRGYDVWQWALQQVETKITANKSKRSLK
ncbi:SGNH/GDSL hydrolase family protein [Plectonema radiosum NIES-515]|uniref:SGNH/GDSL hydrolase family protein n=1 Tax=Plectonema radiosum NIES-515 TaxID=2986073 RepID=A0ABT3AZC3_9CYAN|nr:SGNH/GDSL hydrolase family protein [Plectonema radiosum]MCV3214080.1 SGNH/GDSL hydrolase family protein [Plectonema radiosum NIES-515]